MQLPLQELRHTLVNDLYLFHRVLRISFMLNRQIDNTMIISNKAQVIFR